MGNLRLQPYVMAACLLLAFAGLTQASQVRPVNLEEMTERAATIFSGRCLAVNTAHDPSLGRKITEVTFAVDQVAKGEQQETVKLRMLDGAAGLPTFREGEDVVLFLYGESSSGLSSPVGFGQGKFSLIEDKLGRRMAVNEFGNKNLMRGLSTAARQKLGPSLGQLKGKQALESTALLDLVEQLKR